MRALEVVALIASVASLVVSVLAIWLAITFYRMTRQLSEGKEDASRRVESALRGLQEVVGRLEAEVPDPQMIEERLEAEIAQLKREVEEALSSMADKVVRSDGMLSDLGDEVRKLVGGASPGAGKGFEHGR